MKSFVVIAAALVSIASAGLTPIVIIPSTSTLLRSPQRDSAIVRSERLGGNFAYAIAEGQSFQSISPIVTSVSEQEKTRSFISFLAELSKLNQS